MHTSTEYGQNVINSHRFPLPPVPWPLPPRCSPKFRFLAPPMLCGRETAVL